MDGFDQSPVCLKYLERCFPSASNKDKTNEKLLTLKPDSVVITDVKAIPILLNLAATFDESGSDTVPLQSAVPVNVIPSSYKIGCLPKGICTPDSRTIERREFLRWCHTNLKGVEVFAQSQEFCQAAYLQAIAAFLSSQSVILSSEIFTSGFNGLGVFTLIDCVPNCERVILGKPLIVARPVIVGVKVIGKINRFTVSTDLVLNFIRFLRGISQCVVEVWGPSLHQIALSDRIALANMVKETNLQAIFFPCDEICHQFLKSTSDILFKNKKVKLTKAPENVTVQRTYDQNLEFDLSKVHASISGPKRESDRISVEKLQSEFDESIYRKYSPKSFGVKISKETEDAKMSHGTIVGVSLAGCTNSSNALVTLQAGLLAKSLVEKGIVLSDTIKGNIIKIVYSLHAPKSKCLLPSCTSYIIISANT